MDLADEVGRQKRNDTERISIHDSGLIVCVTEEAVHMAPWGTPSGGEN